MCTGVEIAALISAAATTYSAVNAPKPKAAPMVDPAADAAKAADLAAQESARAKLDQRRRSRANSLLSAYSEDDAGKATLGA